MASRQQHQAQWEHNRLFLKSIIDRSDVSDWITTVTFYTALHAIQVLLIKDGFDRAHTHEARYEVLLSERKYKSIRIDYKALYDASRAARYDCSGWLKASDVRDDLVSRRLLQIENHVIRQAQLRVTLPALF
jgi:hypothetical protein